MVLTNAIVQEACSIGQLRDCEALCGCVGAGAVPLDEVLAVHHVEATSEVASPSAALDCCLAATCPSVVRRRCCRCRIHLALVTAPVSCAHPQGVNDILEAVSLPPLLAFASKNGAGGRVPGVLRSVSMVGACWGHVPATRLRATAPGSAQMHRVVVHTIKRRAGKQCLWSLKALELQTAVRRPSAPGLFTCSRAWLAGAPSSFGKLCRSGAPDPLQVRQHAGCSAQHQCPSSVCAGCQLEPTGGSFPGVQSGEGAAEWAASIGRAVDQVGPFLMGRMVGNWWELMGNDGRNSWELVGLMGTGWSRWELALSTETSVLCPAPALQARATAGRSLS